MYVGEFVRRAAALSFGFQQCRTSVAALCRNSVASLSASGLKKVTRARHPLLSHDVETNSRVISILTFFENAPPAPPPPVSQMLALGGTGSLCVKEFLLSYI